MLAKDSNFSTSKKINAFSLYFTHHIIFGSLLMTQSEKFERIFFGERNFFFSYEEICGIIESLMSNKMSNLCGQ